VSVKANTGPEDLGDLSGNETNWPLEHRDVLAWMVSQKSDDQFIDVVFAEMCERLVRAGVPVARGALFFDAHNPQWLGARILWQNGRPGADFRTFDYGVEDRPDYQNSPMFEVGNGVGEVRQLLHEGVATAKRYPIYDELAEGLYTDYVAWPLNHTRGKRHAVTFATKVTGGFKPEDLEYLRDLLPVLALVSEIRLKNRLARTLLETYVGPHASEPILAGATTRGSGFTVTAAVMICDLRDFTAISDTLPRDDVINLLNSYFDVLAEPITLNGGEILKFMGDGLLAIFKLSDPNAAANLLSTINQVHLALEALNSQNEKAQLPLLRHGIGVHLGDVMYGNIGARGRLDFTAIGPAVNVASRLETLTKDLKRSVLLSSAFAKFAGQAELLEPLGTFILRGLKDPIDVFALKGS